MRVLIPLALICLLIGALDAQTYRTQTEVTALTASPPSDYAPTLPGDMLEIYWSSARTGGVGRNDIWKCTRTGLDQPWGTPTNETLLNTTGDEYYINIRSDGLEMIISTNRNTGGTGYINDLYSSTRTSTSAPWGTPTIITELNSTSAADTEDDPTMTADGLEIFFTSDRSGGQAAAIWTSTRKDFNSPWSAPTLVAEIDTSSYEHSAAISGDGLTLIFSSNRPGGTGSSDHYLVTRKDRNSKFGTPVELKEINSTRWDHNGTQTDDGFSFYFTYDQQNKIYRADRILPACWPPNGNPKVGQVFDIYVRRDIGDRVGVIIGSLASIPPTPIPPLIGTLEVHLGLMVWYGTGAIDKEGKYTSHIPIPNLPPLRGIDLYFQGAVQNPTAIYLSNLCKVTIE